MYKEQICHSPIRHLIFSFLCLCFLQNNQLIVYKDCLECLRLMREKRMTFKQKKPKLFNFTFNINNSNRKKNCFFKKLYFLSQFTSEVSESVSMLLACDSEFSSRWIIIGGIILDCSISHKLLPFLPNYFFTVADTTYFATFQQ